MPTIVITGFMGCGKTEVAQKLAQQLQRKPIDLDDVITEREGRSPARLISEDGESYFRNRETAALSTTLKTEPAAVVALGGGAWIQDENRKLVDEFQAASVWLDVPFEVCWQRITDSAADRPLGRTKEQAQALYSRRLPIYRLAQFHFDYLANEPVEMLGRRIATQLAALK